MPERDFPLRVVLSVTTGRLLTAPKGPVDNGIAALYDLLGHMTGDSPFTHQLPRFADECKPWLLRWFPKLAIAETRLEVLDAALRHFAHAPEVAIDGWLAALEAELGGTFAIGQIPRDDHERKDPYDELVAMRGTDEGIVIVETEARDA